MLSIRPIPAFNDNYIWALLDDEGRAAVVDPGDAEPVQQFLEDEGIQLAGILITHHHFDHVGGLEALKSHWNCPVWGPVNPTIEGIDHRLSEGDEVQVLGQKFQVIGVPGHTLDHIAYFADGDPPRLFCGDTLFAGGCGRVFEGTFAMMHGSLAKLAALPGKTLVYCAHEYTLANLAFAQAVEPDNAELSARVQAARATRERQQPTVPSTLAQERATNPFLRCDAPELVDALERQGKHPPETPEERFALLRDWKDHF
jgi:hydroxyacylglutathione hydrolase